MAGSLIKRLPLTEAQMWFPIHLDDIVKVHQESLQRRKIQCLVGAPPERQNKNSFKWIICTTLSTGRTITLVHLSTYQQKNYLSFKKNHS